MATELTWEQRSRNAADAIAGHMVPEVPWLLMDRALKAAGLRDLIVERDGLWAELEQAREALRVAADDLDKAANQFAGMRAAGEHGPMPEIVGNPEIFAEKAERARAASSSRVQDQEGVTSACCRDCGWSHAGTYDEAVTAAGQHARHAGHVVLPPARQHPEGDDR